LVDRVVRADRESRAGRGDLAGGGEHDLADGLPVARVEGGHVVRHREALEHDLRVVVLAHHGQSLEADRAVTEGRALGAAGHDADRARHAARIAPSGQAPPRNRSSAGKKTSGASENGKWPERATVSSRASRKAFAHSCEPWSGRRSCSPCTTRTGAPTRSIRE